MTEGECPLKVNLEEEKIEFRRDYEDDSYAIIRRIFFLVFNWISVFIIFPVSMAVEYDLSPGVSFV